MQPVDLNPYFREYRSWWSRSPKSDFECRAMVTYPIAELAKLMVAAERGELGVDWRTRTKKLLGDIAMYAFGVMCSEGVQAVPWTFPGSFSPTDGPTLLKMLLLDASNILLLKANPASLLISWSTVCETCGFDVDETLTEALRRLP